MNKNINGDSSTEKVEEVKVVVETPETPEKETKTTTTSKTTRKRTTTKAEESLKSWWGSLHPLIKGLMVFIILLLFLWFTRDKSQDKSFWGNGWGNGKDKKEQVQTPPFTPAPAPVDIPKVSEPVVESPCIDCPPSRQEQNDELVRKLAAEYRRDSVLLEEKRQAKRKLELDIAKEDMARERVDSRSSSSSSALKSTRTSKSSSSTSSSSAKSTLTRQAAPASTVVEHHYYYNSDGNSTKTVEEAVAPRRSSSYESYDSSESEVITTTRTTSSSQDCYDQDCWPTLKPELVKKYGLHYKSDGRVYQKNGSLYKGKEQPFVYGVVNEDDARGRSSNVESSSSYTSTTTSSGSGSALRLKPGYKRGPNGYVVDKNGNRATEDPFIR